MATTIRMTLPATLGAGLLLVLGMVAPASATPEEPTPAGFAPEDIEGYVILRESKLYRYGKKTTFYEPGMSLSETEYLTVSRRQATRRRQTFKGEAGWFNFWVSWPRRREWTVLEPNVAKLDVFTYVNDGSTAAYTTKFTFTSETGGTYQYELYPQEDSPGAYGMGTFTIWKAQFSEFHKSICATDYAVSSNPWHINNLYNCEERLLYVPYHLWTGAEWNGVRYHGPDECMHPADTTFSVNGTSKTRIYGPETWTNPATGQKEQVWVREKADGSKTQRFTCHYDGIGRVADTRQGREDRYWQSGRCKFPAGFGFDVGLRFGCDDTSIEITEVGIDEDGHLTHLTFKWWAGDTLDHIYRYEPGRSMTRAWRQT